MQFRDEATPNSRKKPDGVMGCELRCYVGDTPPADPEDHEFCAIDTATPYLMVHDASEAKKNAHVVGRWVNTRGEKGPWSETVMATISADFAGRLACGIILSRNAGAGFHGSTENKG